MNLEEVYKQIDAEAEEAALVYPYSAGGDEPRPRPQVNGVRKAYYIKGAAPYAEKWQEEKELRERYEKALKAIREWQLPSTGKFWDEEKTQPMSYGACYGSNGERDYFKWLANEALTPKTSTDGSANG